MRLFILICALLITKTATAQNQDTLLQANKLLTQVSQIGASKTCVNNDNEKIKDACKMHFGWGHCTEAKATVRLHKNENWVVQGCNIGQAGFGSCMAKKGIFQKGPNGDWFEEPNIHTNGGLNLIDEQIISKAANISSINQKINMSSFIRMSQYNWLILVREARKQLLSGDSPKCKKVEVSFSCLSAEESVFSIMKDPEWERRLKIANKKVTLKLKEGVTATNDQKKAIDILNRFETLGNCGTDKNIIPSIPLKCGEKFIVTKDTKISEKKCIDFMSTLEKREIEKAKGKQTAPLLSSYPETGPIY